MAFALVDDLIRAGCNVTLALDPRFPTEPSQLPPAWQPFLDLRRLRATPVCAKTSAESFCHLRDQLESLSDDADHVIVIAPESEGRLETSANWFPQQKLLSPDIDFIRLVSNKLSFVRQLEAIEPLQLPSMRIPASYTYRQFAKLQRRGNNRDDFTDALFVVKPKRGAGSENIQLIKASRPVEHQLTPANLGRSKLSDNHPDGLFVQRFQKGTPISCSVISNGSRVTILPPTEQKFDRIPIGEYIGWNFPLPSEVQSATTTAIQELLDFLPNFIGYVGFDLVVSHHDTDLSLWLIEANPRLTMSYLALRQFAAANLAEMLLPPDKAVGKSGSIDVD